MGYMNLRFMFLLVLIVVMCSCNNTGYEIEEEESTEAPKSETHAEIKQDIEQPKSEIKDVATKDTNRVNKTSPKEYFIQLGAFSKENNAKDFAAKVQKQLDFEVSYVYVNGLFKVKLGNFKSKSEAYSTLQKVNEAGFDEAFVQEMRK